MLLSSSFYASQRDTCHKTQPGQISPFYFSPDCRSMNYNWSCIQHRHVIKNFSLQICHMLAFILPFCWICQRLGFGLVAASTCAGNMSTSVWWRRRYQRFCWQALSTKYLQTQIVLSLWIFSEVSLDFRQAPNCQDHLVELWFSMFRFYRLNKRGLEGRQNKPFDLWRFPVYFLLGTLAIGSKFLASAKRLWHIATWAGRARGTSSLVDYCYEWYVMCHITIWLTPFLFLHEREKKCHQSVERD